MRGVQQKLPISDTEHGLFVAPASRRRFLNQASWRKDAGETPAPPDRAGNSHPSYTCSSVRVVDYFRLVACRTSVFPPSNTSSEASSAVQRSRRLRAEVRRLKRRIVATTGQ